jgi:hypothetical protein
LQARSYFFVKSSISTIIKLLEAPTNAFVLSDERAIDQAQVFIDAKSRSANHRRQIGNIIHIYRQIDNRACGEACGETLKRSRRFANDNKPRRILQARRVDFA